MKYNFNGFTMTVRALTAPGAVALISVENDVLGSMHVMLSDDGELVPMDDDQLTELGELSLGELSQPEAPQLNQAQAVSLLEAAQSGMYYTDGELGARARGIVKRVAEELNWPPAPSGKGE